MNDRAKTKRRWLRFTLRTLMLLAAVACCGFGWIAYELRPGLQQKAAVEAIQKSGGFVVYDYKENSRQDVEPTPPGPAWLRKQLGEDFFAKVTVVGIRSSTFSDAELAQLQCLTQLKELYLHGTQVTDAGLARLQGFTQLKTLNLDRTQVTDAGLVHLYGLSQLRTVYLYDTKATKRGALELRKALPDVINIGP
jgi:hypothetical protein